MNIKQWLEISNNKLKQSDISTPLLDSEVLLADALEKDRSWIHAHPDFKLTKKQINLLDEQIRRRARHEPLAYIRGKQEFYGRDFAVSPDTLTPRPETETMIELLLKYIKDSRFKIQDSLSIVDIGTGSGNIIITAALELTQLSDINYQISYYSLDVSRPALKIAKQNAKNLKTKVGFQSYDLMSQPLTPHLSPRTIILANLPYVPNNHEINRAAKHEPKLAIFGGKDGLDYYRVLFKKLNNTVSHVLTESLQTKHKNLTEIANKSGYKLKSSQDLIQVFVKE